MKAYFRITFCLLSYVPLLCCGAQDTFSISERFREHHSLSNRFVTNIYSNPAASYLAWKHTFSEFAIGERIKNSKRAVIAQLGEDENYFLFDASSYTKLSNKNHLWGSAYFNKGERTNVKWSESSDFLYLYPYITADTAGGDFSFEEYFFSGGFARASHKISWGVHIDYRARIEYRKIDPRPRNIVSDLKVSGGVTHRINKNYALGFAIYAGRYNQTGSIAFYDDMGAIKIFHLTGLGMDHIRFSGTNSNTRYDGREYGAGVDFFPYSRNGVSASIKYNYFTLEKILDDFNTLCINESFTHQINGEIAWSKRSNHDWGVKVKANYSDRTGIENLFGDSSDNQYPKIGENRYFSMTTSDITLSGIWGNSNAKGVTWHLSPLLGLDHLKIRYKVPLRLLEHLHYTGGAKANILLSHKKSFFKIETLIRYKHNANAKLTLSSVNDEKSIEALRFNHLSLSANGWKGEIALRWNYTIAPNRAIFINTVYNYTHYNTLGKVNDLHITCGLAF